MISTEKYSVVFARRGSFSFKMDQTVVDQIFAYQFIHVTRVAREIIKD